MPTPKAPWDMRCQELLLWLSREEWHLREECCGPTLERLMARGFAKVVFNGKRDDGSLDGIALTAMGWAEVARVQERHRVNFQGERSPNLKREEPAMQQPPPTARSSACSCGFVHLVIDMRRAQRRYYRAARASPEKRTAEKRTALEESMVAERAVDAAAARLVAPTLDLMGGGDDQPR